MFVVAWALAVESILHLLRCGADQGRLFVKASLQTRETRGALVQSSTQPAGVTNNSLKESASVQALEVKGFSKCECRPIVRWRRAKLSEKRRWIRPSLRRGPVSVPLIAAKRAHAQNGVHGNASQRCSGLRR